ncbi:probable LRR receptor-like serine/threonine-protein kinase At3g47570 [Durio zibethinus]|uniref:non-specific serine/threonine protein kinase n=1 Tax=Durio zibethinus TaxID=66656 RepID=A0A6P6AH91_DURZI|nr:probable LRR receptor-like serine/threonine-protein kinase At3g47570 [Durio zibethinus]
MMKQSSKHLELSSSLFFVYLAFILLAFFNLQGPKLLGSAIPVVNGNETDRRALFEFKAKIIDDHFGVMRSWNNSNHFCQWYGVACGRRHQRVTMLDLGSLKLVGSISPFIGNLSFLRLLNLENNSFNQAIPQEIGRLQRLRELILQNNTLSGEIPSNLSRCSRLASVNFRGNLLTGEIPGALSKLSKLTWFSFKRNNLRGSIPTSMGNLSSLVYMNLGGNILSGVIPEALGKLTKLEVFFAADNRISGVIPASIFNLSSIRVLHMNLNRIQGSLPSDLGISMPHIEILSVAFNQLVGPFPVSISNASNLVQLFVAENKLSGNLPSFEKLDKLSRIVISNNLLGSTIATDLNFLCTLTNASRLELLWINENNFGGELPECVSNLSHNLLSLNVQLNKLLGRIPAGIGNLINLELLAASENQLSGSIPPGIGRLQKLGVFYASRNSLSGVLPPSFGNLTMLTKLALSGNNLQGNIPSSLGKCENLIELYLYNNNLSGSIPPEVIGLSSLSLTLDLSSNYLTGVLPVEVENLKNLGELRVSQNSLSGVLPTNLGSCVKLERLFLDGNMFQGPIPSSLSSLKGLIELDISSNNLSGEIPKFLVSFGSLLYLNISFNNFEGMIPIKGVFKNASAIFVEGNSKLCGGTPELRLPRCNSKTSIKRSTDTLKLKFAILFSIFGVILVVSCPFILWFRRKREQPKATCAENPLSMLSMSYQSILKATGGLSPATLVGFGSFGSVYKGILEESGVVIAVKVLNLLSHGASRSFMAECEALKNIRHRNLVKVLTAISGADYQGNDFKALVYEFMQNGSLEDWLHPSVGMNEVQEAPKSLKFFQRLNVAVDVGCALEYLHHHCETPIVHCDLKPSNVLLDDEMVGHVGDFGLAKFIASDTQNNTSSLSSSLGLRGTVGYAPPEYGLGSDVTTYGDVYSYGILLLEMFTGKRPTGEMFTENLNLHNFVKTALPDRVAEITDPILLQESFNESSQNDNRLLWSMNSIFEIGVACSFELPTEQMNMANVVAKLCFIRDNLLPTRSLRRRAAEYGLGSNVTTYGDVDSYGILLLEMFTGKRPTDEMFKENQNLHNFVKTALPDRVAEITDPILLQESFNESSQNKNRLLWSLNSTFEIGVACSFELSIERMNMANVVAKLCFIRDNLLPTRSLRTRSTDIILSERLNVAVDVGCALESLRHHCETPIVQSDLKRSNVLLDDVMVVHVGDFGLAKFNASDTQNNPSSLSSSLGLRGTIGYAPQNMAWEVM